MGLRAENSQRDLLRYGFGKDYAAGLRRYQPDLRDYQHGGSKAAGDINVHIDTIKVPPGTHTDDIKRMVSDAIVDATAKNNQRVMSQTAAGAYY